MAVIPGGRKTDEFALLVGEREIEFQISLPQIKYKRMVNSFADHQEDSIACHISGDSDRRLFRNIFTSVLPQSDVSCS